VANHRLKARPGFFQNVPEFFADRGERPKKVDFIRQLEEFEKGTDLIRKIIVGWDVDVGSIHPLEDHLECFNVIFF
jgi:hypothetical protein